jgi:heme oxygenase
LPHRRRPNPPKPLSPRTAALTPDLPRRLREGTHDLHTRAERSGAMAALLAGRLPRARYAALLRSLHLVYAALEQGLEAHAGAPWLRGLDRVALRRSEALEADLAALCAPAEPAVQAPAPAHEYAARLQALAGDTPLLLLAHVYTRYLGDLHGGQILQRLVARQYPGSGTRFYDFGPDARVQALRQGLRGALAAAPLQPGDADRLVAEARWSFEQHVRLFEALAA